MGKRKSSGSGWRTEEVTDRDGHQVVEIHRSALGRPVTEYAPCRGPFAMG